MAFARGSGDCCVSTPTDWSVIVANTFRCTIVTPTESVLDDEVTYATIPAWDGQQGVMTHQSPMLTKLGIGPLRLDFPEGGSRWFLIEGGFAQVQNDVLTLLAEKVTSAEKLSMQEAEAELAEANARVTQHAEDRANVERDQQRAMAKKMLAEHAESFGVKA
jgi:F-type H+-transporting ATPase subunit epsilon